MKDRKNSSSSKRQQGDTGRQSHWQQSQQSQQSQQPMRNGNRQKSYNGKDNSSHRSQQR